MNQGWTRQNWLTGLFLAGTMIIIVVMALLMAPLDLRQTPILPTPPALAVVYTSTPDVTLFPTITPRPTVTQAPSPAPGETATATAVAVVDQCPPPPPGWQRYTVGANETLSVLALRFGTSAAKIAQVNCLNPNVLPANSIIYVPAVVAPVVYVPCGRAGGWGIGWVHYLVQRGDTLYSLALSRHTTVYEVIMANCLQGERLLANRRILLPPLPATSTATATATSTATSTSTSTATATATTTGTPTLTATLTPTATATAVTPTVTISATISATPTVTLTPTATTAVTTTATATPPSGNFTPTASSTAITTTTTTPTTTPSTTPTGSTTPMPSTTPTPAPGSYPGPVAPTDTPVAYP